MNIIRWLDDNLEKAVCGALLSVATIILTMQLILRWTGLPLDWTEEIARYCFVWLVYIACAYGVKERAHISVEITALLLKEKGRFVLKVISNVLFFIFAIVITYNGFLLLGNLADLGQVSPAVQIPMVVPYSSYVVGFLLVMLRLVQDTIKLFIEYKQGQTVKEEK